MHLPLAVGSIAHDITPSVDVHPYILACVIPASPLLERWRHIRDTLFFRAQMPWKDFHAFVLAHLPVCGAPCRARPLGAVRLEVCARDTDAHKRQRPVRALGRCSQRPRNMTSPLFAKQATQGWATTMPCEPCFSLAHLSTHQRSRAQFSHRWARASAVGARHSPGNRVLLRIKRWHSRVGKPCVRDNGCDAPDMHRRDTRPVLKRHV